VIWLILSNSQDLKLIKELNIKLLLVNNQINWLNIFIDIIIIIGIIWFIFPIFFNCKTSNIIITNKNNIVIAPTYIIINIKAIKSKFRVISNPALLIKTKTSQKIEWIGLTDVMVIITEKIIKDDIKINNWSI